MKILNYIWCESKTLFSKVFDGDPHIDGHLWQGKSVKKVGDRYYEMQECMECGKTDDKSWMSEMNYLRMKDMLPPLAPELTDQEEDT